jgi:hypothetical protein
LVRLAARARGQERKRKQQRNSENLTRSPCAFAVERFSAVLKDDELHHARAEALDYKLFPAH